MPLAIPLKLSSDVDLSTRVASFLKNNFSELGAEASNQMATELDKLRRIACVKALDKNETSLTVLTKYHDQLVKIQGKIPFSMQDCQVTFAWKDPFAQKSGWGGSSKSKIALCSGDFEHLCVLWNCAALMSQVAGSQMDDDEGAKEAVKNYTKAAGIFNYIKDNVAGVLNKETPTTDLLPTTLNTLSVYMLGCAQEQIYHKASRGGMKQNVLARLSEQAHQHFNETNRHASQVSKELAAHSRQKAKYFHARANWHQAKAHQDDKQFGETIARLRITEELLKELTKESPKYKQFLGEVKTLKEEVEKENSFIYHCVIPAKEKLPVIGTAAVAKPTQYKKGDLLTPPDKEASDLFECVMPIEVNEANATFESKKKAYVDSQIVRIRDLTTTLNGVLRTMHLPEAIEETSGSGVPRSITDKATDVRVKGGIDKLKNMSLNIPEALQRNQELLTEAKRMLSAEQASDTHLRNQFGAKLSQVQPSEQLTMSLWTDCQKYEGILQKAVEADGIVKIKLDEHARGLELLSGTDDALNEAFPSGSVANVLSDNPVIVELKDLCRQSEALKNERDVMESELRSATVTLSIEFCQALQDQGSINAESMSEDKLEEAYSTIVDQIDDSRDRQESVLANLQRCSQEFSMLKKSGAAEEERQKVLSQIHGAYDGFCELSSNLEEGSKFYNDLTNYLIRLQGKVSDFCFARKTEKDEFLRTQTNVSSEAGNIATPGFLNQTQPPPEASAPPVAADAPPVDSRQAPARPPPPAFQQGPPQEQSGQTQQGQQQPAQAPPVAPRRSQPPQGPPQGQYQPPPGQYQPPPGQYQPPPGQYQPPRGQYQPPPGQHQPPSGQHQPPPGQYQPRPYGAPQPSGGSAPYPTQNNYWDAPPNWNNAPQGQGQYNYPTNPPAPSSGYPQQGYPPQNPGYPPNQQGYPPRNPGYAPYPTQPGYPPQ